MADEQLIKPRELIPAAVVYSDDAIMTDDGVTVSKATPVQIVDAGAPVASEAEAIAGTDNAKRITPLNLKQVLEDTTAPAVTRAQAWAESPDTPDPAIPGSKSSKTWAEESESSSIRAEEFAVLAGSFASESPQSWDDFSRFDDYPDGKVVSFNGVLFARSPGSSRPGIPPGWIPMGTASSLHYDAKGDNFTNDTSDISNLITNEISELSIGKFLVDTTLRPLQGAAPRNIAPASEDFTSFFETMWTLNTGVTKGVSMQRNAAEVPMAEWGSPADRMREEANTAPHRIEWATSLPATPQTVSIYVKVNGTRQFAIQWSGSTYSNTARIDPSNGAIISAGDGVAGSEDMGDGWWRFYATFTPTVAESGSFRLWLYNGGFTYAGDTSVYADLYGFQLENSASVSAYQSTPIILPRLTGQRIKGETPFKSTLRTNNKTIMNIRNATGLTVENVGFTHDINPASLRAESGVIDETVSVVNTTSVFPSADVTLKGNLWNNVSGTCIDIYGSGAERWQVIGNRALEIGLAFLYASVKSQDHIVALNHILNPGDATIVFNGPSRNNMALGNHIRFRGERHVLSGGTGGHAFVTQGKYNLYADNMVADCGGTFVQVMTGLDGSSNTTADGNLYHGNVFDGIQLREDQQNSFGDFILRPQNDALNVFSDQMIRGKPFLDLVHSRAPSHGAGDVGGDWIFRNCDIRDLRYVWYAAGNGRSLTFKGCTFRGLTGDALFNMATANISWDELVVEDCVFDCGTRVLPAILKITQATQTLKRFVFRRNRILATSITQALDAIAGAMPAVVELAWEDNELPSNPGIPSVWVPKLRKPLLDLYGSGTPEGVVNAPVGSRYARTDGSTGTSFYVKEAGTGSAGWVAK